METRPAWKAGLDLTASQVSPAEVTALSGNGDGRQFKTAGFVLMKKSSKTYQPDCIICYSCWCLFQSTMPCFSSVSVDISSWSFFFFFNLVYKMWCFMLKKKVYKVIRFWLDILLCYNPGCWQLCLFMQTEMSDNIVITFTAIITTYQN